MKNQEALSTLNAEVIILELSVILICIAVTFLLLGYYLARTPVAEEPPKCCGGKGRESAPDDNGGTFSDKAMLLDKENTSDQT